MQTSSNPPVVPPDKPRLFLRGVVPSITDQALQKALSRFGTPGPIERHARSFAHVSLDLLPDVTLDQCIRTLDNTKWSGALLHVSVAREHFLSRLEREWREDADVVNKHVDVQVVDEDRPLPFADIPKGAHTKFSFSDVSGDSQSPQLVDKEHNVFQGESRDVDQEWKPSAVKSKVTPVSSALNSTMQLFGLATDPTDTDTETEQNPAVQHFGAETKPLNRQAKRPRTTDTARMHLESAEAVGKDPALINLEAEKNCALSVLEAMFPSESAVPSNRMSDDVRQSIADRIRRPGLFRNIQFQVPVSQIEPRRLKRVSVKRKRRSLPSVPSNGIVKMEVRPNMITSYRRAGLYRKLIFVEGSNSS